MWELDHKESWAQKNWCFWTVVFDKTLESPLDCKEIQAVHSEGDQPWDFFGRNDAKAETPVLWPPHAKSWLIGKGSDPGRDWGQEEKGTTKDEMAGWHHWLDGRESEWTPGVGDGQGGLACCDSRGHKELDTTERLNWTELIPSSCTNKRERDVRKQMNKLICLLLCVLTCNTGTNLSVKTRWVIIMRGKFKALLYLQFVTIGDLQTWWPYMKTRTSNNGF